MKTKEYCKNILRSSIEKVKSNKSSLDYLTISPTLFERMINDKSFDVKKDIITFENVLIEEGDLNNPVVKVNLKEVNKLD